MNLFKKNMLAGRKVDNSVGNNNIKQRIRKRQLLRINLFECNIYNTELLKIFFCPDNHRFGQINSIHLSIRPSQPAGHYQIKASTTADIKDNTSAFNCANGKGIANPAKCV